MTFCSGGKRSIRAELRAHNFRKYTTPGAGQASN